MSAIDPSFFKISLDDLFEYKTGFYQIDILEGIIISYTEEHVLWGKLSVNNDNSEKVILLDHGYIVDGFNIEFYFASKIHHKKKIRILKNLLNGIFIDISRIRSDDRPFLAEHGIFIV